MEDPDAHKKDALGVSEGADLLHQMVGTPPVSLGGHLPKVMP